MKFVFSFRFHGSNECTIEVRCVIFGTEMPADSV